MASNIPFSYNGFDWIKPRPGGGMYRYSYVLALLALCMLFGLRYRPSATLFFLAFATVFLLDKA